MAALQEWRSSGILASQFSDKDNSSSVPHIQVRHFDTAFSRVHPSVSASDRSR